MPVLLTVTVALAGAALATVLRVPAAPLVGAMVGVGLLKIWGVPTVAVPGAVRFVVYAVVGLMLGEAFTRQTVAQLRAAATPILLVVALFLVFGGVLAWALWRFAGFDAHTALLASAPGGIAQMGVLSAESQAVVPVVLTVHLLRITSVILVTSVVLKLLPVSGGP